MNSTRKTARGMVATVFLVLLAACAGNDGQNHAVFEGNMAFDTAVLEPIAKGYNTLPDEVREAVAGVLDILETPRDFGNHILQGNADYVAQTLLRTAVNATVGLAGLWDPATKLGLERHEATFGQTCALWGGDYKTYVVLPILGPSDPCNAVGFVPDALLNAGNYIPGATVIPAMAGAISKRAGHQADIEDIKSGLDPYARLQSMYSQNREAEVRKVKGMPAMAPAVVDYTDPQK